jgi:hypothetical protein
VWFSHHLFFLLAVSLDNPYDKATKKAAADIFGDLDASNSYAYKPPTATPLPKRTSQHAPAASAANPPAAAVAPVAPVVPIAAEAEVIVAVPASATPADESAALPAARGAQSLLEQVMAEAMDAKLRAFRQLAAESGVDVSDQQQHEQEERARAVAAVAAAAGDPRRRFAFDIDDDDGDDAVDDGDGADVQRQPAPLSQPAPPQQRLSTHADDEYEREQAIAASIIMSQPEPILAPALAPAPAPVVPAAAAPPATNPFAPKLTPTNPFAGAAAQAPAPAAAPKAATTNPFATAAPPTTPAALHSTQYTAGAGLSAGASARAKVDGVEIVQVAKTHGFVVGAVEMPGLPWLVRIGEPEVRNPLNPATKYVVYPVMTKAFGWKCERRFSDFIWLREQLLRVYPGTLVPPLPDKKFFGRFSENFVEKRREALERFLNKCTVHRQLRGADALRFFLEKRDAKLFEQEKADYGAVLPRLDPAVFERNRAIDQNVMAMLAPIINYLNVMQEYLTGLATLTSSLEQRRREEAEELRRMGATFGALFACADSGGYCWRESCRECDVVGAQMQSLGLRSARVSQVVDDCGANIYNAVWRSVRDECDTVASLRELVHQRVMIEAEYKMAVETLKETRAARANVLAKGALPKGPKDKDSPAAKLAQQVLVEEAAAASLKFKLDYVTMVLLDELDAFHARKAATFGVLLNHYATQSAFAAEQLHQAWADVLRAAQHIATTKN